MKYQKESSNKKFASQNASWDTRIFLKLTESKTKHTVPSEKKINVNPNRESRGTRDEADTKVIKEK
jgi:hypothetical protein